MDYQTIAKKVEAERDVSSRFGIYKLYSFIIKITKDPTLTRKFLILSGYTKTDATNVASRYNYHNKA